MKNIQHKNILSLNFLGYFSLIMTEKKNITSDLQIKIWRYFHLKFKLDSPNI